jgi:hypothetical protein
MSETQNIEYKSVWKDEFELSMTKDMRDRYKDEEAYILSQKNAELENLNEKIK